jgi:hypothetical protein
VLVVLAVLAFGATAFAALGGDVSSVEADQQQMRLAARSTQATEKYTVHELRTDDGPVVREFASPSGRVFGVAWQSPTMPDLRQLLGSYYEQFQKARTVTAATGAIRRRGPIYVKEPGLVVESGGHMRAYVGRAYDPSLLPAGVSAEEIK